MNYGAVLLSDKEYLKFTDYRMVTTFELVVSLLMNLKKTISLISRYDPS